MPTDFTERLQRLLNFGDFEYTYFVLADGADPREYARLSEAFNEKYTKWALTDGQPRDAELARAARGHPSRRRSRIRPAARQPHVPLCVRGGRGAHPGPRVHQLRESRHRPRRAAHARDRPAQDPRRGARLADRAVAGRVGAVRAPRHRARRDPRRGVAVVAGRQRAVRQDDDARSFRQAVAGVGRARVRLCVGLSGRALSGVLSVFLHAAHGARRPLSARRLAACAKRSCSRSSRSRSA